MNRSGLIPQRRNPFLKSGPFPNPMEGRDYVTQRTLDKMHGKKKLFIERVCPKCHTSNFSIRIIPEQFQINETAIIGAPECNCNGDFFVRLDPKLKQIFIFTLMGHAVPMQKIDLFSRIFFAPIINEELNVVNLVANKCSAACKGQDCECTTNPANTIAIHPDFEMIFVEKMSPSPFPDVCFTPDDIKKIICILFG